MVQQRKFQHVLFLKQDVEVGLASWPHGLRW